MEGQWKAEPFRPAGKNELPRELWRADNLDEYDSQKKLTLVGNAQESEKIGLAILREEPPNLIGSRIARKSKIHPWRRTQAPVLDFDFPCRLVPSATPNHYHLYIDKPMTEEQYGKLLRVMVEVGLLQTGFAEQHDKFDQTFVRWGVLKSII